MKRHMISIIIPLILSFMVSTTFALADNSLHSETSLDAGAHLKGKKNIGLLAAFLFFRSLPDGRHLRSGANNFIITGDRKFAYHLRSRKIDDLFIRYGYNDSVRSTIEKLTRHKYTFQKKLAFSGRYIQEMKDIFLSKGLPEELAYLPLIESGFDPFAYSHRHAVGPWQFMKRTARKLGLRVDQWVDERRDPIKSTKAAADYLKYLYERFGSWSLALAAYNAGEGRIRSAIRNSKDTDFWSIRKSSYLKRETKEYVPLYVAAAAIAMHPEKFGFKRIPYHRPRKFDEVLVTRQMDFDVIAKFAGVNARQIRELNPELRQWCTPPDESGYRLKIPKGTKKRFMESYETIRGDELEFVRFYKVQSGDTVAKIARKLGTSVRDIITRNELGSKAVIMAGRRILIPLGKQIEKMINRIAY